MQKRVTFPFSAIVNLEKLKLAILINAINPKIGGLLIRGPKGSGKTTIVRALADILPKIKVVKGCPFNCNPYDPTNMCPKCLERYRKGENLPVEEREMTVVDLPLGATEDRVVGSLDVERAIKYGIEALEPGILAEANQNILYVDEINLLPDHIADDLLDAAATGWNVVEREGVSVRHPSRFIFIGTMNPEEGELRPQLLDRFPLSVTVERITSVEERMEIVKRNLEFENDPEGFIKKFEPYQNELRERIIKARELLSKVRLDQSLLEAICKACLELKVDGLRPDIVISKAACTLAALENRTEVTIEDVILAAELALSHRTREGGFLEPATPEEIAEVFRAKVKEVVRVKGKGTFPEEKFKKKHLKGRAIFFANKEATKEDIKRLKNPFIRAMSKFQQLMYRLTSLFRSVFFGFGKKLKRAPSDAATTDGLLRSKSMQGKMMKEEVDRGKGIKAVPSVAASVSKYGKPKIREGVPFIGKIVGFLRGFGKIKIEAKGKKVSKNVGKRAESVTALHRGRSFSWRFPKGKPRDIHLPASLRAAAKRQIQRKEEPTRLAIQISLEDVREKLRLYKAPATIIFVIDLSGSMLYDVDTVKEAILRLHSDAYRYRDKVGIVALKDFGAVIVQHPITNLRVVANKLSNLRVSGYTPLAAGMLKGLEVIKAAKRRDPSMIPLMVIITDGNANVPLKRSLETGEIRHFDEIGVATREFEDLAVRDVVSVSKIIRREGISTVVINTNPHIYGRESYGLLVTKMIASITKGAHYEVGRTREKQELTDRIFERIDNSRKIIFSRTKLSNFDVHSLFD